MRYLANLVPELLREQRTVNPLIAPARYNFLYSSSRPTLRAASGRPPARQRHDGHRERGLPQARHSVATKSVARHYNCRW
jgi:hypothetical protein